MFNVIYIILSLLSGAFVLPLLVFIQVKYKKKLISKYIAFFLNIYLILIILGSFRIYDSSGYVMHPFVLITYFLSLVAIIITMPLFFNSFFRVPIKKNYTIISIFIAFISLFSINDFGKYYELRMVDLLIIITFIYCLISSIINYKKLQSNVRKKIGLALIIFNSLLFPAIVFDSFSQSIFILSFFLFLTMNVLSIVLLCHFLKFNKIKINVAIDINNFNLTPREIEVFHLIKKGLPYKEICEQLSISNATVKTHLNKIYKKTNTKSRFELAATF